MERQETPIKQEVKGTEGTRPGVWYEPRIDICETPDAIWLWADMPGVDEKSVEIRLDEGILSIEGHVSLEDYEGLEPSHIEYNVGNFSRRLRVSERLDHDRISARMKDGVLEVTLPKAERAKARRIPVQTN